MAICMEAIGMDIYDIYHVLNVKTYNHLVQFSSDVYGKGLWFLDIFLHD